DTVVDLRGDLDHAARAIGDRDVAEQIHAGARGIGVLGPGPGRVASQLDRGHGVDLGHGARGAVGDPDDRERVGTLAAPGDAAITRAGSDVGVAEDVELGPAFTVVAIVGSVRMVAIMPVLGRLAVFFD